LNIDQAIFHVHHGRNDPMKHNLRNLALPAALAAALLLAACGTGDTSGMSHPKTSASAASGTPASKTKNAADVTFVTMMIPHHNQAVEMAELAIKQASDPGIKALAPKIKAAQRPEVDRMSGWLAGWGVPVPGGSGGHDMSAMGDQSGGMMSGHEMTSLGKAKGSGFDRMWLQMMVRHHQGAVGSAKTEVVQGVNPESKKLAQAIIDSQSAEITEMKSILVGTPT